MAELSMEGGSFSIVMSDTENASHGRDKVDFLVSTNPGQDHHPLKETASGGELSRISLAIQVALADKGSIPILVFDEVDVGIGGKTAATVGQLLNTLGKHRQVICITHLPQVAAWGNQHCCVEKHTKNNITETQINLLSKTQTIEELARMLGGQEITEQTLATAKEMISQTLR
jgi:DNA repair protein RecN (Recombination protein N)